jgi:5'-deoxynucleotidase YfbR-like HD superfamily hydrolase
MKNDVTDIVKGLIELQRKYAFEARMIISEERFVNFQRLMPTKYSDLDYAEEMLREPLIEHIGHLPIIATYLHQYIEHTKQVDLGRALIMLSIHDIGETILGDIFTLEKTHSQEVNEHQVALKQLPSYLQVYLIEYETRETYDSKFAKAVDSIAPLLHEIVAPALTYHRFAKWNFNTQMIYKKKLNDFKWDKILSGIFELIIGEYNKIEKNQKTIFVS